MSVPELVPGTRMLFGGADANLEDRYLVSRELDLSSKCALALYLKPGNPRELISEALATYGTN